MRVGARPIPPFVVLAVCAAIVAVVAVGKLAQPTVPTVIRFAGYEPAADVADLMARADAVVVARYTGESNVHWNNSQNKQWTSDVLSDVPMIYRDDVFMVDRVIRGKGVPGTLVIRGLGGTADGVNIQFEGQVDWPKDRIVVLLLAKQQTPTQSGAEEAWTVVGNHQGAFFLTGETWKNDIGKPVDVR